MIIYIFGNGNIGFQDFIWLYGKSLHKVLSTHPEASFIVCDYKGVDTLAMEYLKTHTRNVSVYHVGSSPRYFPSIYKTNASKWKKVGRFESDEQRDDAAIDACTHFMGWDFNSNETRRSGTLRNIESCQELKKVWINETF